MALLFYIRSMVDANITEYQIPKGGDMAAKMQAAYEDVLMGVVRAYLGREPLPEDAGCLSKVRRYDFGMTNEADSEAIVTASGVKLGDIVTGFYWDETNSRQMWSVNFVPASEAQA